MHMPAATLTLSYLANRPVPIAYQSPPSELFHELTFSAVSVLGLAPAPSSTSGPTSDWLLPWMKPP